ncbi:type II secretion system protein GspK [Rheinheimera sp. MMS21-TC3]|uniref:general secretion pathway protein GspK n=1 Tax=Rheinheimera sp. MMS21-TC3 TaxID=3072790 RepID=UPI0028C42F75|nr:type II secretion system protein GspK [Rheinheimera sp. MMS21-TC3]WNO61660.1 type II secretion system protein GspK [Rheinheimera sp. MMS21-TC3]
MARFFCSIKQQKGVALILVLMLAAVIATVVTVYQYKSKANIGLAQQAKNSLLARAAVESAKEELIYLLQTTPLWAERPNKARLAELELPEKFNFWGTPFTWNNAQVQIFDTASMVPVHPFEPRLWLNFLYRFNVENPDHVVAAIEDWIDADDFLHLNGAEKQDYASEGLPRNGLPQTTDELGLVKGLEKDWSRIGPYVTFMGSHVINYEFAPDALLPVLLGDYRAEQFMKMRNGEENISSDDLMVERSEDMMVYLSRRLKVSIDITIEDAAYRQSFVVIKANSTKRISYVAEKQPGYIGTDFK